MTWTRLPALEDALNAEGDDHAYVLVDSALYGEPQRRHPLGVDCATLVVDGAEDDEARAVLPLLMAWPADESTRTWLAPRSIQWALDRHAATWLRSPLPLKELAEALGRRMDALLDDGTGVLLRFADARILGPLPGSLTVEQQSALFAPVARWWYLDRGEQLQEVVKPHGDAIPVSLPIVLAQHQLDAMLEAAEPDFVMQSLDKLAPRMIERVERRSRHSFVQQQVERARAWGMEATADFALFCALVLERGEQVLKRPQWATVAQQAKAGTLAWSDALTSDALWN